MLITIIRHGESVDNLTHKWSGKHDCDLTNWGYLQATLAGEWLKKEKFTHVFSSDLKRAKMTCEAILRSHDYSSPISKGPLTIHLDARLQEQNFGIIDGKDSNLPEVKKVVKEMILHNRPWEESFKLRYPGGESKEDVYLRCYKWWDEALNTIKRSFPTLKELEIEPHVLIVSHGLTIRQLIHAISKHPFTKLDSTSLSSVSGIQSDNTGIWRLEIGEKPLRIHLRNCVDHFLKLPNKRVVDASSPYDPTQTKITSYFSNSL